MWRIGLFLVVASLTLLPATASAKPGTCDSGVAWNYERPLEALPPLPEVPSSHELPFGPGGVRLTERSSHLVLQTSPEEIGETGVGRMVLTVPPGTRVDWLVTVKLTRVNVEGEPRELADFLRRRVRGSGAGGLYEVELPEDPALGQYKREMVIRDGRTGSKLGSYGSYSRVVAPLSELKLTLNGTTFRPGDTVEACLENYGTTSTSHGDCGIGIEVMENGAWIRSPKDPPHACTLIARVLRAGASTFAGSWQVPSDAPPGQYRASQGGTAFAEFQVVSAAT